MKLRVTNKDGSRCGLDFMCFLGLLALMIAVSALAWAAGRIVRHENNEAFFSMRSEQALPSQLPRSFGDE